jgi:hypothetical protein
MLQLLLVLSQQYWVDLNFGRFEGWSSDELQTRVTAQNKHFRLLLMQAHEQ